MRTQALLAVFLAGVCFAGAVSGTCTTPNYPDADIYIVEAYSGFVVVGRDSQNIGDQYTIPLHQGTYNLKCLIYDTSTLPHTLLDYHWRNNASVPESGVIFVNFVF